MLFGAWVPSGSFSAGDDNLLSVAIKKSSGSGLRANVYSHSSTGQGSETGSR